MQPLKKIIDTARIVALGEATHGTREFFQLKHRLLEFLVTQMGFSILSVEASMPEAYRLNDFVLKGEGDPAKLRKSMPPTLLDTQKSGKRRVEFTGFDMQNPAVAVKNVRSFVAESDLEARYRAPDSQYHFRDLAGLKPVQPDCNAAV